MLKDDQHQRIEDRLGNANTALGYNSQSKMSAGNLRILLDELFWVHQTKALEVDCSLATETLLMQTQKVVKNCLIEALASTNEASQRSSRLTSAMTLKQKPVMNQIINKLERTDKELGTLSSYASAETLVSASKL